MVDQHDGAEPFDGIAERLATRIMELANVADDEMRAVGIREIFAADYVLHSRTGGTVVGIDDYIERIATNLKGLTGMHFEMDDLVAQRDRFALRYHWTAPHGDGQIRQEALEINRVGKRQGDRDLELPGHAGTHGQARRGRQPLRATCLIHVDQWRGPAEAGPLNQRDGGGGGI